MASEITIASTTDDMTDLQAAAKVTREEPEAGLLPEPVERAEEPESRRAEAHERPGKAGFQKRIDKLTRERYQDKDRIQQLEAQLRELEGQNSGPRESVEKSGAAEPERREDSQPQRHEPERDRKLASNEAQEIQSRFARDYEAALPKGSPERAQLEEAAMRTEAEVGGIHPGVAQIVMSMPNSLDVYAHLCTHPDDLRVLNASRSHGEALANVRYISGVLRGMVHSAQAKATPVTRPQVKRPPEPVRPVRGTATSFVSLEEADYQTYKRIREQQEKNRYRY